MNILLEGDVTMSKTGNENFKYSGKVNIIDGRFYDNQGNIYEDMYGSIFLTPDQNASYMEINSSTLIDSSIIDVTIMGNPYEPEIYFSSTEVEYSQTELLSILAFGSPQIGNDPKQAKNFLTNYLENEIERNISQNTPLD